ncbi:MAG: E3 binding domain-containing protein, partial [Rhodospirillales bacterium]|nr:E3 binding domain-containing protein [Rhodospirillales bacterium]
MAVQILMPALSPTMTDGKLAKWLKKEGDAVESGDVIAEIETDKATMEMEAVDEGKIGKILVAEGTEGVAVNAPIAVLLEEGDDDSAIDATVSAGPAVAPAAPEPAPAAAPAPTSVPAAAPTPAAPPAPAPVGGRVFASPLARRMAEQAGLDLSRVSGSGPNGRIVKADIEAALAGGVPAAAPAAAPSVAPTAATAPDITAPVTEVPNSMMRKV